MAFNNLGLQEPSTITARVATVTIARGSTTEHQEIMVLGDPTSSNGVARVLASAPASTEFGLGVRIISGPSSAADLAVRAVLSSTSTDNPVSAVQSGAWTVRANLSSTSADNPVNAAQAGAWTVSVSGYSTTVNVSSLGGKVAVVNSSAGDLNVTVAGYSTTANISSVAGVVTVTPQSSAWQVQVTNQSTTVAVSSLGGIVAVRPSDTNWASSAGFHFDSSGALQIAGTFNATTSTVVTVSQLLDSSGGSVAMADSANNALRVNVVAGAAGGSTIVTVSTGSVRVHQSTAADLLVTASQGGAWSVSQASTVWAVQLSNYSTTANVSSVAGKVSVVNSSAADLLVTASQGSTVWAVQLSNYSTTAQVSSVGGVVTVQQNSTVWAVQLTNYSTIVAISSIAGKVSVVNSSAADLDVAISDGVGNALESSTSLPSSNARGLVVRQVIPISATYSASTTGQSSATTIFTSNATVRPYVFAYSVISTLAGPVNWSIQKGSTRLWGGVLAAVSSAVSGANLSVSPPGFLFAGSTGRPLSFNCETSNAGLNVSIAYWQCP